MKVYSRRLERNDDLVAVALFRCFRLFGPDYWYCRFMVDNGEMAEYGFYSSENENKFTAYRNAMKLAQENRGI